MERDERAVWTVMSLLTGNDRQSQAQDDDES